MKKFFKYLVGLIIFLVVSSFVTYKIMIQDVEFGGNPLVDRADLLKTAPNFKDSHFHNTLKERPSDLWVNLKDFWNSIDKFPPSPFPQVKPQYLETPRQGLHAVWFGHASVLVEIDGHRVFFDPVLSDFAFPVKSVAPQRQNPPPLSLEELPTIDAVVISHDHYDHLDMKTLKHLAKQGTMFFVGLGVGAHLEKWNIPLEQIKEMKWGDSISLKGLTINCTEARHYSGRKAMSMDTLWTSWVIQGEKHTVFHSGDSGYSEHFKLIGDQFPNIDISLIKVGDYGLDLAWQDIHMVPESSIQAHIDLGAKVMIPIHWGVFILSNHSWNEPIERALAASKEKGIELVTPKLGEEVIFGKTFKNELWWRNLK